MNGESSKKIWWGIVLSQGLFFLHLCKVKGYKVKSILQHFQESSLLIATMNISQVIYSKISKQFTDLLSKFLPQDRNYSCTGGRILHEIILVFTDFTYFNSCLFLSLIFKIFSRPHQQLLVNHLILHELISVVTDFTYFNSCLCSIQGIWFEIL